MSGRQARRSNSDLWAVWQILPPSALPLWFLQGLTGSIARTVNSSLCYSDVCSWFLPGLKYPGFHAELIPFTPGLLRQPGFRQRHSFALLWFEPQTLGHNEAEGFGALSRQAVLARTKSGWQMHGEGAETQAVQLEEVQMLSPFVVQVSRADRRGFRRAAVWSALQRWAAFYANFPQYLPTLQQQEDVFNLQNAALFLGAAATGHTRENRLLRKAAQNMEKHPLQAHSALYEAVVIFWQLPYAAEKALLETEAPLSAAQVWELEYLTRAAVPELRALAAARLQRAEGVQHAEKSGEGGRA